MFIYFIRRWENLQGNSGSGVAAPVLGLLLSEGPLRIITQGQELSSEYDERTLLDVGFKDNQVIGHLSKLLLFYFINILTKTLYIYNII